MYMCGSIKLCGLNDRLSLLVLSSVVVQPRECLRSAEKQTVARLEKSFEDLNCRNILGLGEMAPAQNVLGPRRGGLPV